VSGYSASETVAEKQARFVEVVLPMNSMTVTRFVGIYVGTKEMAELNTPFEQEQVGTVSKKNQNITKPSLRRKHILQMSILIAMESHGVQFLPRY